jgi:hypothetical protein
MAGSHRRTGALLRTRAAGRGRLEKLPDGHYRLTQTRGHDVPFTCASSPSSSWSGSPRGSSNLANPVLYAGVLAPHAKLRTEVVKFARPQPLPDASAAETLTLAERESWAELMRSCAWPLQLDVLVPLPLLRGAAVPHRHHPRRR